MVDITSFLFRVSFDLGMSVKNEVINNYTLFFYSLGHCIKPSSPFPFNMNF